jgi:hypothetical protein
MSPGQNPGSPQMVAVLMGNQERIKLIQLYPD